MNVHAEHHALHGDDPRPVRSAAEWADVIRAHGLRVTPGRVAALVYIDAHPHVSAADIYRTLREDLPSTSQQAAFNIVHDLHRHDLLRRIDLPDSDGAQYETRTGDNHHHVQCIICGRIEDVDCVVGASPCLEPSDTHGMRILVAEVTFRGICPACEEAEQERDIDLI